MAYYGERLLFCRAVPFNFHKTHIVVVSGDKWNPCGHALLNTGGQGGYYFHAAGDEIRFYPRYMNEEGYQRYLKEHGKKELRRQWIPLKNPLRAQQELDELLSRQWVWLGLKNNCATLIEEILKAGGATVNIAFNCPELGLRR